MKGIFFFFLKQSHIAYAVWRYKRRKEWKWKKKDSVSVEPFIIPTDLHVYQYLLSVFLTDLPYGVDRAPPHTRAFYILMRKWIFQYFCFVGKSSKERKRKEIGNSIVEKRRTYTHVTTGFSTHQNKINGENISENRNNHTCIEMWQCPETKQPIPFFFTVLLFIFPSFSSFLPFHVSVILPLFFKTLFILLLFCIFCGFETFQQTYYRSFFAPFSFQLTQFKNYKKQQQFFSLSRFL